MRAALLAVFLVSCAAPSTRREFHDGPMVRTAPVFVAPGYTPAGAGLPEYVPAGEASTVPRGKDRRVRPPTREPGIWASDGDETRAANRDPLPVIVGGVRMPAPVGEKSTAPMRVCGTRVNSALKKADQDFMYDYFGQLGPRQYSCAMAWLFHACLEIRVVERARFSDATQTTAARDAALATKADKCNRVDTGPESPVARAVSGLLPDILKGTIGDE